MVSQTAALAGVECLSGGGDQESGDRKYGHRQKSWLHGNLFRRSTAISAANLISRDLNFPVKPQAMIAVVRRSARLKGTQTWTDGGKTITRACTGVIKRPLRPFLPRTRKQAAAW
jgi:hypothetical protein